MQHILMTSLSAACALMAAASAGGAAERPGRSPGPNIVFILADDLGYGDLGCYGQRDIRTPNLDFLAQRGTRFTQCYAGSTVCAPSRACLMTGLHTGHVWVRGNDRRPLRVGENSVARLLQMRGYRTACIGKWGLGEPDSTGIPTRQGFDYFFGYLNQAHAHNSFPDRLWRNETVEIIEANQLGSRGVYSNDLFTEEALRFIEANRRRPFFLYLAHTAPHANSTARTMEVPEIEPEYRDKPWPMTEKIFASTITRMDRDIGRIITRLDRLGLGRQTIVFFSSDNGPHREGGHDPTFFFSSGGLRGIKRDLYEGGIRVPMIVAWPGKVPSRRVCQEPWAFWDFLPTVADLVGAQIPGDVDGVSVLPILRGERQVHRPPLYWEFHEGGFSQAARRGDWKAVRRSPGAPVELYALNRDPGETNNAALDYPEVARWMEEFLNTARTDHPGYPVHSGN